MKLTIIIDIDTIESGLNEDDVKDDLINFTKDLLINGAENQEIALTLNEVDYQQN